jgi:hypothetical protein
MGLHSGIWQPLRTAWENLLLHPVAVTVNLASDETRVAGEKTKILIISLTEALPLGPVLRQLDSSSFVSHLIPLLLSSLSQSV